MVDGGGLLCTGDARFDDKQMQRIWICDDDELRRCSARHYRTQWISDRHQSTSGRYPLTAMISK